MKYLTLILCLTSACFSAAQTAQESVISIKGTASVSVKPTVTIITMDVRSTQDSYTSAIENMINRIDQLTAEMKQIGFKEEEIVTSNFFINKRLNYNQNRTQTEVFDANQTLRVQFTQDKDKLLEVLNRATSSEAKPEISISFDLDNKKKQEVKDRLIKLAIKDAKNKAALMVGETGYLISGIKTMSYGQSGVAPDPLRFNTSSRAMDIEEVSFTNMEVANLSFTESVDITYLIEKE